MIKLKDRSSGISSRQEKRSLLSKGTPSVDRLKIHFWE